MLSYTLREAAQITGLTEKTLRKYIKEKRINASIVGNQYRIGTKEIQPYVKQSEQVSEEEYVPPAISPGLKELLVLGNDGFKALSHTQETTAVQYRMFLENAMGHVIGKQTEKEAIEEVSAFSQDIQNNFISMAHAGYLHCDVPIEQALNMLLEGTNTAEEVKNALKQGVAAVHNALQSTQPKPVPSY